MLNKIIHGDCLQVMKDIPDKSVDCICCDLPYGITQNKWDSVIPLHELWIEYKRIIKENGAIVLFSQQPFTSALISSNYKNYKYSWYWEKTQSVGHLNAYKQPMRKIEEINIFYKKQSTYNYQLTDKPKKDIRPHSKSGGTNNYGCYNNNQEKNRKIPIDKKLPENLLTFANAQKTVHPTEKPISLLEYLIRTYTNTNELVVDNCIGSGTTSVACINTNRNFIGIEKEKKYVDIANKRISDAIENITQQRLSDFEAKASTSKLTS
jgi:site-specific DNA-methyltransferase (adenine-specific)